MIMDDYPQTAREEVASSRGLGVRSANAAPSPAEKTQKIQSMVEEETNQLLGNILRLEDRLSPVLESRPETSAKQEDPKDIDISRISTRVKITLTGVRSANQIIINLIDRLEI